MGFRMPDEKIAEIEVEIMRDIWVGKPGAAERIRQGTWVKVPLDEKVLDGIASGAVRRVQPGEKRPELPE